MAVASLDRAAGCYDRSWPGRAMGNRHAKTPLRGALLTLVAPDLMGTTATKGHIVGAAHELPMAFSHVHGESVA